MSDRIYCYPNSDVLINKLNIHDKDKLIEAERKLTMLRLMDLLEKPCDLSMIPGPSKEILRNSL